MPETRLIMRARIPGNNGLLILARSKVVQDETQGSDVGLQTNQAGCGLGSFGLFRRVTFAWWSFLPTSRCVQTHELLVLCRSAKSWVGFGREGLFCGLCFAVLVSWK